MATLLLAWELGGGTGHCVNLLPLAKSFCEQGHTVFVALRDISIARRIFGDLEPAPNSKQPSSAAKSSCRTKRFCAGQLNIRLLQAPYKTGRPKRPVMAPRSFAHILHNTGFEELDELQCLTDAWYNLFQAVKPDAILFEHCPSGLLASRRMDVKRIVVGTGFFSPPDVLPWPDLRTWLPPNQELLQRDEDILHKRVNRLLERWNVEPLERLGKLYADVDLNALLTFEGLDHYPQRTHGTYWGNWNPPGGECPEWPNVHGKRIFGYFRPFDNMEHLFALLNELDVAALLNVPDGLHPKLRKRFESKKVRFVDTRLDLAQVAKTCDLAILNANAGTTLTLLRHGIPALHIPQHLEQAVFARRISDEGLGQIAAIDQPGQVAGRLISMLQENRFAQKAEEFSLRYKHFDQNESMVRLATNIEKLV